MSHVCLCVTSPLPLNFFNPKLCSIVQRIFINIYNGTSLLRSTTGNDVKDGLYRIWCGVNRLGDSGVHTLGDT